MRARPGRFAVAALALALASSAGAARAEPRPAAKAPRIVAHEWGVWKVRAGAVAHLEDLAAESPWFVHRARGAPAWAWPPPPPPPVFPPVLLRPLPGPVYIPVPAPAPGPVYVPVPRPGPGPVYVPAPAPAPSPTWDPWSRPRPARKPVLFLTTDRPVDMTVSVAFRGGGPWLYYPAATEGSRPDGSGELLWQGRLVPRSRAPLQPVPPGHFWNRLRDVGADLFLSGGGTAERFLFFDGPVAFERPFAVATRGGGVVVAARSTERSLWLVGGGRWSEVLAGRRPAAGSVVAEGPIAELPERLHAALVDRDLSPAEARSLLDTWDWELFRAPGRRAIAFVPRELYDHMLPCRIDPEPVELVRVGLVIEDLEDPTPRP